MSLRYTFVDCQFDRHDQCEYVTRSVRSGQQHVCSCRCHARPPKVREPMRRASITILRKYPMSREDEVDEF